MNAPELPVAPCAPPEDHRRSVVALCLAVALVVLFGLAAYSESLWLPPVDDSDEAAYFDEACWIAEHGGAVAFPGHCLRGEYPYDNRHPLTAWAVSPWAARSLAAVRPMRAAKVAVAVCALVLTLFACRGIMPPLPSVAVTALLAVSQNWFMKSRVVCVEPMIYALIFTSWALVSGLWRPPARWFWAGAAVGAAYLAKGTANILVLALLLALAVHWLIERIGTTSAEPAPRRVPDWRPAALFLAGFILCAGLLLARNTVRYGAPFHNRNAALMWADDDGAQHWTAEQRARNPLTLRAYLQRHSLGDVAERMGGGIVKQAPRFLGALGVDASCGALLRGATLALSACIILLGLVHAGQRWRSWEGVFTLALVGSGFLLFAWHSPITSASRFAATLAPPCLALAFMTTPPLPARWVECLRRWRTPAMLLIVLLAMGILIGRTPWRQIGRPAGAPPTTPEYRFLLAWLERHCVAEGKACYQTPFLAPRYPLHWLLPPSAPLVDVPPFRDFAELQRQMDADGARYLIVERDSMRDRWPVFSAFFDATPDGGLVLRRLPAGWHVGESDPYPPCDFIILERDGP